MSKQAKYIVFMAGYGYAKMLAAHLTQAQSHGPALRKKRCEWFPCSRSSEIDTTVYSNTLPAVFIELVVLH